jgi:hypothetical protein
MPKTIDDYFDEIDAARSLRVRELSEIKRLFSSFSPSQDPLGVQSKALVVLSYAAWEGFYNECVDAYCDFLVARGTKVAEAGWNLLVGVLEAQFESLRGRNHSPAAKRDFTEALKQLLTCDFTEFDRKAIKARSNLNWQRLTESFLLLDFDVSALQKHRNRLEVEVVGWRHGVAHGSAPSLGQLDADGHIRLVGDVMVLVADAFQAAMLDQV